MSDQKTKKLKMMKEAKKMFIPEDYLVVPVALFSVIVLVLLAVGVRKLLEKIGWIKKQDDWKE